MLSEDKWPQYGGPLVGEMLGLTIHDSESDVSAKEIFEEIQNGSGGNFGVHYLVDEEEVIEVMPTDWFTWNTGKHDEFGDEHTIVIEICRSRSDSEDLYIEALERAVELIKKLKEDRGWDNTCVFFHHDFNQRAYCPHKLLDMYGNKANFIREVL